MALSPAMSHSIGVGILGGGNRAGAWVPARHNWAVCVLGGCELDFRKAQLGPGVTEVHASAVGLRVMNSFLFDVNPGDPAIASLAAATLTSAVILASYLLARRAWRLDPVAALRR